MNHIDPYHNADDPSKVFDERKTFFKARMRTDLLRSKPFLTFQEVQEITQLNKIIKAKETRDYLTHSLIETNGVPSTEAMRVLFQISAVMKDKTENSMVFPIGDKVAKEDRKTFAEVTRKLQDLGFHLKYSCSSNWCNETITIQW